MEMKCLQSVQLLRLTVIRVPEVVVAKEDIHSKDMKDDRFIQHNENILV